MIWETYVSLFYTIIVKWAVSPKEVYYFQTSVEKQTAMKWKISVLIDSPH